MKNSLATSQDISQRERQNFENQQQEFRNSIKAVS